jgi:DNA-binding helix-hairpin-helix protein with protein kinase domain
LQKFEILYSPIPSFGAAKKRLIYNNGIRTAADIKKLNSIKISGIGPKNIQVLNDWQRHVGASFTYTPDFTSINHDVSIAANEIAIKRQRLEIDIKSEYKGLIVLRANILSTVDTLERQYNDVTKKLYQSELDLKAFQNLIK